MHVGFREVEELLEEMSAESDQLETLTGAVVFKRFQPIIEWAAGLARNPKAVRY